MVWEVPALRALAALTPQAVLQIQRILMEAFTNVLKHAGASEVRVAAGTQVRPGDAEALTLFLSVTDNGCGLPSASRRIAGHGLTSMHACRVAGCTVVAGNEGRLGPVRAAGVHRTRDGAVICNMGSRLRAGRP